MSTVEAVIFILLCGVVVALVVLVGVLVFCVADLEERLSAIEDGGSDDDPESDDEPVAENVVVLAQRRRA